MKRETIWVTGCEGRLGSALLEWLSTDTDYKTIATDRDVSITNLEAVEQAVSLYRPNIVINCAGISDKAFCEENELEAYRVNALGARNLAIASNRVNAFMVHISTDDVFSGMSRQRLTEFDTPDPISVFGKSELAGEGFVSSLNPKHLIIRSSWVYGLRKADASNDYYVQVLEHGKNNENFEAPIDVISTPTSAIELSRFLKSILETREYGIYHVSCEGACTRYEYAQTILSMNGYDPALVKPSYANKDGKIYSTHLENLMLKMTEIYTMPDWKEAMKEYVEVRKQRGV